MSKLISCREAACISLPIRIDTNLDAISNSDLRRALHQVRLTLASQNHSIVLVEYLISRLEQLYNLAIGRFENETVMLYASETVAEMVRLTDEAEPKVLCSDHFDVSPLVGAEDTQNHKHFKPTLRRQHQV